MAAAAAFPGFSKTAFGFWHELAHEMNKPWFEANKARYDAEWVQPMTALLASVAAKLGPAYRGLALGAPRIRRIYRDVRFGKDKTPYKTWIGGGVPVGAAKQDAGAVALYAHFGLSEEYVGAGQYTFTAEQLVTWRKRVADPKTGGALARLVDKLTAAGYSIDASETLARVPKPYPADHPRAELLKRKGLVVGFPEIPKGLVHKPQLADWLSAHAKAAAPLVTWLTRTL